MATAPSNYGNENQGPLNGGVSNGGGFPDLDLSLFCPFLSFWDFPGDFPDLRGGWSGDFPDLSFSSFSAY